MDDERYGIEDIEAYAESAHHLTVKYHEVVRLQVIADPTELLLRPIPAIHLERHRDLRCLLSRLRR